MNSSVRHNESHAPQGGGLHLGDIYFVIFRHKWKIVILTLLGLIAAVTYRVTQKPYYKSSMTIMVKYVSYKVDPTANDAERSSFMTQNESIMGAEMKMLTSFDVATEVASNIGPDRILGKNGGVVNDPIVAALAVQGNLDVRRDNNQIQIIYGSPDISLVKPVLLALDAAYHERSDEFHQQTDWSTEALTKKAYDYKNQIDALNQQLQEIKAKANIINVGSSDNFFAAEQMRLRQDISQAQESLDEHNALMAEMAAASRPGKTVDTNTNVNVPAAPLKPEVPLDQVAQHKTVSEHQTYLQNKILEYLNQNGYTDENKLVKAARAELATTTKTKTDLEKKYPSLAQTDLPASTTATTTTGGTGVTAPDAAMVFSTLPTRIKTLQLQLSQIQSQALAASAAVNQIEDLESQKKVMEDAYQKFNESLQDENFQTAIGPNNSNIPELESPTPPFRDVAKLHKTTYGLAVSGLALGLAWAFLIEFYLDRSIKRPIDIQNKLKIPFFLSIPDLSRNSRKGLAAANQLRQLEYKNGPPGKDGGLAVVKESSLEVMGWEINRRFNSYYDALRDRLVVYFESINLTRKPKLVAVTSTHKGAGVSTIAAGLAASLSETGDGRVLLVDMNLEHGSAQQFFNGRANCKLDDALESETRDAARVQENLYFVTEDTISDRLPRALPKRFASLIPKLKASDYDYIIFDMPPVSPTSVTSRLAGFMDTVMLVIESEKTDQQVVQQANALLAQSKANVTAVLNKTKHYVPSLLHRDFLSDV